MFADRISGYLVALLPHLKDSLHVAILNQYYKVFSEFERLGDHAVNIANNARSMSEKDTAFSSIAMSELNVLYSLLEKILDETEIAFGKRDLDAAYHIQPLRKVTADLIGELKDNHLSRMSRGQCNVFLDPNFENLLSDMMRIADVSSNVGESVVIRVRPELADKEHHYFRDLRHEDPNYNRAYLKARDEYFEQLSAVTSVEKENAAPAQPGQVISAAVRDFDDA